MVWKGKIARMLRPEFFGDVGKYSHSEDVPKLITEHLIHIEVRKHSGFGETKTR
jgi:hypothetical protein